MNEIAFKYEAPRGDRRHFVNEEDVRVVLSRLPSHLWSRLQMVYFKDHSRGRNILGYVTRGRREIVLCALPSRISFTSGLRGSHHPAMFGAIRGSQWPTLAVRRYMLYVVLLHEIGHLQIIHEKAKTTRRKFAMEPKAEAFAETWCKTLWDQAFDHPDPVHNRPSAEEQAAIGQHWRRAHDEYKKGLNYERADKGELAMLCYGKAIELYPQHALALEAQGVLMLEKARSHARAYGFLKRAVSCDPTLPHAHLFLGIAAAYSHREGEARRHFATALPLIRRPKGALAVYAYLVSRWGCWDEAKSLFKRALSGTPNPFVQHFYREFLLDERNPERSRNIQKALQLKPGPRERIDLITRAARGLRIYYSTEEESIQ